MKTPELFGGILALYSKNANRDEQRLILDLALKYD